MGRWSRLLAPHFIAFAGVKNGDRVLDVGTGTGSVAAAVEASMPASEIVGIDPSKGFIAYAQKNAKSTRARFEVGDAQALKYKDASFDNTLRIARHEFHPRSQQGNRRNAPGDPCARHRQCLCLGLRRRACRCSDSSGTRPIAFDPAIEPKDERHMKLSRQGQLGDLWKKAGLINVKEEPLVIDQTYSSFNDYWESFTKGAGPGGAYVVSLSEDRRQQLEARMRKRLLGDRTGWSIHAESESLVRARRSSQDLGDPTASPMPSIVAFRRTRRRELRGAWR